jgi:hypothetical protein
MELSEPKKDNNFPLFIPRIIQMSAPTKYILLNGLET